MISETARQMARAVLDGDEAAAKALRDILNEEIGDAVQKPVVTCLKAGINNYHVMIFAKDGVSVDQEIVVNMEAIIKDWLSGKKFSVVLSGIDRVEFYEVG